MANLRDLRRRISGVKNTSKITQAMKMVSAAKLKRAQNAAESSRPYTLKLQEILQNVIGGIGDSYSHPLLKKSSEIKNIALLIVGSDRGLCGGFNAQLYKYIQTTIKEIKTKYPESNISLITVGNRPNIYYKKQNLKVDKSFIDVFNNLSFERVLEIVEVIENKFVNGEYDKVFIAFNEFKNIIRQIPIHQQILPIESPEKEFSAESKSKSTDYIFEPNQSVIMDELLPKLLNINIWRALLESNVSEQASRMMAMDTATTNANELIEKLNLTYNKERQAAITKEMLEIVSGADALSN